jgi:cell division protein FtsQ
MRIGINRVFYVFGGIACVIGISAGLIFAYDLVTQADYFTTSRIDISGNHRLSEKTVLTLAQIDSRVNIFSVNLFLTRKRLSAHPWVASARVVRKTPKRLMIHITEHTPLALIDLGRKFMMNADGDIFKEASAADRTLIPVVEGLTYADIQSQGKPNGLPFRAVMAVLRLGQKPGSVLRNRKIQKIHVDRQLGLTLYAFGDTAAIKLGYNDYPEKYRRLSKVLSFCRKKEKFRQLHAIDLNNVNRIVVYPVRAETGNDDKKEA